MPHNSNSSFVEHNNTIIAGFIKFSILFNIFSHLPIGELYE